MSDLFIEDVEEGANLPILRLGPISLAHIVRWSAAIENWHRIHYDARFATVHEGLPDVAINGSWKQHLLIRLLTSWAGAGWLWKLSLQFRAIDLVGDTLTAWGTVLEKRMQGSYGAAGLRIGMTNQRDVTSVTGKAIVVLPRRGGPRVPYPFVPEHECH